MAARIGLAFTLALAPLLIFIVGAGYRTNSRSLCAISESYCEKSSRDAIAAVDSLLTPPAGALRAAAGLAAIDPLFFRSEKSRDYLHAALAGSEQIDAIYASFEDGYHRVVTRVDEGRRNNDPQIPANARWHSSTIDKYGTSRRRIRHRTFFADWPAAVKTYDVETDVDIRDLPHYRQAKEKRTVSFSEPLINLDTGGPILSIGYPILQDGRFIGFMGANITFDVLAKYLDDHKVGPNSVAMIVDSSGQVIAHPDLKKCVRKSGGAVVFANMAGFSDQTVRDAAAERGRRKQDRFIYKSGEPPAEYAASFAAFPEGFGKEWAVLTITPTDDFLGGLKADYRRLLAVIAALVAIELAAIVGLSKKIAGQEGA